MNGYAITDVTGTDSFQGATVIKVQQSDGRLVVGGSARVPGSTGNQLVLVRYLADGSALDPSFGGTGVVTTQLTSSSTDSESLQDLAIQPDGKIVVAAHLPSSARAPRLFAVVRYTTSGALDPTFGTNGVVAFGFEKNAHAWAYAVAVLSTGKILVAGTSASTGNSSVVALARLNANGSFDSTFDGDGKATISLGRNTSPGVYSMLVDPSGRAVIVGVQDRDGLVMRVTTAGALDATFNGKGWTTLDFVGGADYLTSVAIDGSGRIVAGGRADLNVSSSSAQTDLGLVRYNSNGTLDATFGVGGKVTLDVNGTFDVVHGLAIQPDGHIVVAGEATAVDYSAADSVVARFNDNGTVDSNFGSGGITITDILGAYDYPANMVLQPDGSLVKIVMLSNVGHSTSMALTRYFE